ncbi:MAG TPA: DM13 domain-containing protein, partial [Ilumatobacteraceae bacterium]|nr:DM13 domain-containing protein [Ilumatobacteraceae bacterium]
DGSTQRFLRFEDFETDNGPDLNVYLSSAAPDASVDQLGADFVDLGDLKGNVGPQNFEIPTDVDLDRYSTVVVWCVRFGVAFGSADLIPPA